MNHNYPKLHNAMWPGLVGKGGPDAEPCIDLDTLLDLTARTEVNGVKFDGVDLFLFDPHVSIDSTDDDLKSLADKVRAKGLVVGSLVAPVWPPTGGGSAMGNAEDRAQFVTQIRKSCRIAAKLRDLGIRPDGLIRIDSACGVAEWAADPRANTTRIAATFFPKRERRRQGAGFFDGMPVIVAKMENRKHEALPRYSCGCIPIKIQQPSVAGTCFDSRQQSFKNTKS